MEKSIESIWSEGFINSEELKAPKINDLYNRKSKLLIEKIKKTYTLDNILLLPISLIMGIVFSTYGYYLVAIYSIFIIICLFFFNKSILNSLENIKITADSYEYLVIYQQRVQNIIKKTTKLLGLLFPLIIIPGYFLFFRNTDAYNQFINDFTTLQIIGILIVFSVFLGAVAISIYKISTKIMYGTSLNRLNEIIKDIKELRE